MLLLVALGPAPAARADDQAVLLQLLRQSDSFRVRARAALALGSSGDERAVAALEHALRDRHVAVRAASARALGQIGSRRSVPALRAAAADPAVAVADQAKNALRMIAMRDAAARGVAPAPQPAAEVQPRSSLSGARYALVLGDMRNRTALPDLDLTALLGERIAAELHALGHVAVYEPAAISDATARELRRRRLPSFRIEGTLECVDGGVTAGEHTMRCNVSLLLLDEPGRNLRSLMKGSASAVEQARGVHELRLRLLAQKTLKAAVRSAMANAQQAMEAASAGHDLVASDPEAALPSRPTRKRR